MSDKTLVSISTTWSVRSFWTRLTLAVADTFEQWRERARLRRELAAMSGRELRDIGVTEATARDEIVRPIWFDYSPEWRTTAQERRAQLAARRRS